VVFRVGARVRADALSACEGCDGSVHVRGLALGLSWLAVLGVVMMSSGSARAQTTAVPTRLGDQLYPFDVTAHVDADGTARVGYLTGGGYGKKVVLWASSAQPGKGLPRARPLLRFGPVHQNVGRGQPTFAWDDQGRAIVAWDQGVHGAPARRSVFVAVQGAAGWWSTPIRLSDASHLSRHPALAVDPEGDAIVAWETLTRAGWHVEAAMRRADAMGFGRRWRISLTARGAREPVVAIARGGQAIVAWREHRLVRAARASIASGRGTRLAVGPWRGDNSLLDNDTLDAAVASDGTAVVTWANQVHPDWASGPLQTMAALLRLGEPVHTTSLGALAPGELEEVGPLGGVSWPHGPQAAITTHGEAIVVAERTAGRSYLGIFVAPPGSTAWSAPQPVGDWNSNAADMSTSTDGRALLTWAQGQPDDAAVYISIRPPDGVFGTPIRVARASGLWPSIAASAGTLLVAWQDLEAVVLPAQP
jgi:hypothetical protein